MSQQPQDLLDFDVYTIDIGQRVLLSRGTPVPLSPKVFDTLLALAEEPGRVLGKDHLLKKIWPDSFVEEGSLARNVSTLRRVLGKSPEDQEYIETIPKRGYRFKGAVRRVAYTHATPRGSDRPPDEIPLKDGHEAGAIVERAVIASTRSRVGFAWSLAFLVVLACAWRRGGFRPRRNARARLIHSQCFPSSI